MPLEERESCFLLYKKALYPYIEASFTWDEDFQKKRFYTKYDPNWFYHIHADSRPIGFLCFFETDKELHLSLLIILEAFRGQGYGHKVMKFLHERADQNSCPVTLSSFKNNTNALNFYKKQGYVIKGEDTYFYDLVRNIVAM